MCAVGLSSQCFDSLAVPRVLVSPSIYIKPFGAVFRQIYIWYNFRLAETLVTYIVLDKCLAF